MERLSRVLIKGFRSIRDADLELGPLTVLIGANGAGKSNLVSFFNMLGFLLSGNLQTYTWRRGGAASILHYGPAITPEISALLRFEGDTEGGSEYEFSLGFSPPERLVVGSESLRFWKSGEGRALKAELPLSPGSFESALPEIARRADRDAMARVAALLQQRLRNVEVYHFHNTSDTAFIRTTQDVHRDRFLLSTGGNLAAFLHAMKRNHPAHYYNILDTVRFVAPFLKELILVPNPSSPNSILLRWTDGNPDYEFGPHQLSDGTLRALALVTALLQPEETMPSVIFIDEPELGLHPRALQIIAELVRAASSKRQVIVTTQSPRFLAEFQPEDVVVVERAEYGDARSETVFHRLSSEELGGWLEDYDLGDLHEMNVTGGGPG